MKNDWPLLSYEAGKKTYETLHLWTQIIGKIKLAQLPWVNHSWHITLHITPTGLTTQTIPYKDQHFQIDFDFLEHCLIITTAHGRTKRFDLTNMSVSTFYIRVFELLKDLDIHITIYPLASEIEGPLIPFGLDTTHAIYEHGQASAFHQALLKIQDVLMVFRSRFSGKCSPIQFFWGGFDLSLALYTGKKAPIKQGKIPGLPDRVLQDAYNREVSECGFWPGNGVVPEASFYCYLYPEPPGYRGGTIAPSAAYYNKDFGQFILPYAAVQQSADPKNTLLEFLATTYSIAVQTAEWETDLYAANDIKNGATLN